MSLLKLTPLLIIFHISFSQQSETKTELKAIKALSLSIDEEKLNGNLQKHRMTINEKLNLTTQQLKDCRVIGSISSIDLRGNKNLQFYFTYKLHPSNSTLEITIFAKMKNNQKIQKGLIIVLDFLIAQFPSDYGIFTYNITSYQTHIAYNRTRQYQLIFFLNGFNNFSLSGNITHSYQDIENIYTVHYMSCDGQSNSMGWRQDKDSAYFTLMVVPVTNLVQKFRLSEKRFSLDYPPGYQYFYGIKGSIDQQFAGSFKKRIGGVTFNAQNLNKNKVYGLVFLPYPERVHNPFPWIKIAGFSTLVLVALITLFLLRRRFFWVRHLLSGAQENYELQTRESTKIDLKNSSDLSRQKYEINTVAEVDERYQSTVKNSYQPQCQEEPSLVFKQ